MKIKIYLDVPDHADKGRYCRASTYATPVHESEIWGTRRYHVVVDVPHPRDGQEVIAESVSEVDPRMEESENE